MRNLLRALALAGASIVVALSLSASAAAADPSDTGDDAHEHESHSGPPNLAPFTGPAFGNMELVGNSDKDGSVNSDLAFWKNLAFAGNYHGFRIIDIADPSNPRQLVDYYCRGPQNDVSVYKLRNRLLLFQSVDAPQSQARCDGTVAGSSQDTPVSANFPGQRQFGFEGIRVFDVTDPTRPVFLTGVPTACGSHTHTLIPDPANQRVLIYVASYPLGSGVTPHDAQAPASLRCRSPHRKISIVEVTAKDPAAAKVLREEPLSSDTAVYPGASGPLTPPFQGCHDIQAFLKERIAVGACAGEGQIWDISNPADPTASDGEPHTHVPYPGGTSPAAGGDRWEFVHNAVVTWDARYFALADETGGGGTAECDGSAPEGTPPGASENGFYYFYPMVKPGDPTPSLLSRYMIPRPQGTEICVSHNGNVIPTNEGYYLVSAYYMGGNTLVDFTDPRRPREIAYSDPADAIGCADSWSTYWYNDYLYANGGLNRRGASCAPAPGPASNRGLDVLRALRSDGRPFRARTFHHMNPQTQETFQATGN